VIANNNRHPVGRTGTALGTFNATSLNNPRNKISRQRRHVDFDRVNAAALAVLADILRRWLPDGRTEGHEFVARNPRRADHLPGSFKINIASGRWSDFATGDRGGDPVSLAAYLFGLSQAEAACRLAGMLGMGVPDA
jgi:hypothetical protein